MLARGSRLACLLAGRASRPLSRQDASSRRLISRRSFHGIGSPVARDYHRVLGTSMNAFQKDTKRSFFGVPEICRQAVSGQATSSYTFEDFLTGLMILGAMAASSKKRGDVKVTQEISFMEAAQGCTKTVTFKTYVVCGTCAGIGIPPGARPEKCRPCGGLGTSIQNYPSKMQTTCSDCGGAGKSVTSVCRSCSGRKIVYGEKSIQFDVMSGVDDGEIIKIKKSGAADPKGDPGDLYVKIKIQKDPVFRREKSDIHVDATISLTQAILGDTIRVPTLRDEDAIVKIKPGTQPGDTVVLRGKGIKGKNFLFYGHEYVHFKVNVPVNLTERQRMLMEVFKKEEQGIYENKYSS